MKSSVFAGIFKILSTNRHCVLCQQTSSTLICHYCTDDLPYLELHRFGCDLLNVPKIRQGLLTPCYDRLVAIGDYRWPYSYLIKRLKFGHTLMFANALAEIFCATLSTEDVKLPKAILPIPLHPRRLVKRGYNQSYQIAHQIGLELNIPIFPNAIFRNKSTLPQTELSASARKTNLKGAFSLKKKITTNHIAVFDDVITTGATANEVCTVIKQAYPDIRIDLWTMCISLDRR